MLALEKWDSQSFLEIVEKAEENIQTIYPAWTNYNLADSGMTLLELFAYMTEMQQFHLEQLGTSHYMAFLHLLGICPKGFQAARVYAKLEGVKDSFLLHKGTKVLADTLVFEAEQSIYIEKEDILLEENLQPFYPFGERPETESHYNIRLRHKLEKNTVHTLYFNLYDEYPVPRNPIDKKEFIPFIELQLEYYDGMEYRACKIEKDTTFGLLQKGTVQFCFDGNMGMFENEYRLRLTARGEYDTAPILKGIHFSMVPFVQKDTKIECRKFVLSKNNNEFYEIVADSWFAVKGETNVYIRMEKGWKQTKEFSSYIYEEKRHFVFAREIFKEIADDITICLVSRQAEDLAQGFVCYGTGMPNQQFFLPDHNVLGSSFGIWIEESQAYYIPWFPVSDFGKAGKQDRCYVIDEEAGILKFGNGKQGRMPKGKIEIISYAVCAGSNGNIQKDQISGFYHERKTVRIYNPFPATGGKKPESVNDCLGRYEENNKIKNRAVTREDYEEIIKKTPGLRIKKVKVFPSEMKENSLEIVVQPFTNRKRILKGNAYDKNIIHLLEKRKMLGTHIIIKKPEYIDIFIQLEVMVKSRYLEVEKRIEEHIRKYFDEQMDFGKTIVYSRVFGYIDTLPETAAICSLEIQAGGKGVVRDDNGDIHIPFYRMACLENIKIRCVLMDEA